MKSIAVSFLGAFLASLAFAEPLPGHVETWAADEGGWVDRDPGEMDVSFSAAGAPGGSLAGVFPPSVSPDADAFRAATNSSGGAFTGNYRSKFALIAGWRFHFQAEDIPASSATVRFGDGTNTFFRSFTNQVTSTGVWHSVFLPLGSSTEWSGPAGLFSGTLFNVEFVEVQIVRNGTATQRYGLDNFELVRLEPRAANLSVSAEGVPQAIVWRDLKPGATYGVEVASAVTGSWSAAGALLATNELTAWPVSATNAGGRFHRLVLADPAL
jgi:hypothetical protein